MFALSTKWMYHLSKLNYTCFNLIARFKHSFGPRWAYTHARSEHKNILWSVTISSYDYQTFLYHHDQCCFCSRVCLLLANPTTFSSLLIKGMENIKGRLMRPFSTLLRSQCLTHASTAYSLFIHAMPHESYWIHFRQWKFIVFERLVLQIYSILLYVTHVI